MNTKVLALALVATIVAGLGIAGAMSVNGSFNSSIHRSVHSNAENVLTGNDVNENGSSIQNIASLVQCKTTFADSAAPIASNALNIDLSTSQLDSANARLQANITANASSQVIRDNLLSFRYAFLSLYWQAAGAVRGLNSTQIQSLRMDLNGSIQNFRSCVSSNTISANEDAYENGELHTHSPDQNGFYLSGMHRENDN